jgi:hypothetical protein
MTQRRARLLWPLLLLATCAAAGARLYDEWSRPPAADESKPAALASAGSPASNADVALALPPPEQFAVIVERPLFMQTRRPPPPAPAAEPAPEANAEPAPEPAPVEPPPEAPPPPKVDFTLLGIVTDGDERLAMVRRQSDGAIVNIPEGGDISGWFAVRIDPERAVFRQGGIEEELVLHFDEAVPPESIPPPRAPRRQQEQQQQQQQPAQPVDVGEQPPPQQ